MSKKSTVVVIPARMGSSRFPGKPLVLLLGKPMIIWVLELSAKVLGVENTYVATDDDRIFDLVKSYGFKAVMTHENHATGTDRLSEVAQKIEADFFRLEELSELEQKIVQDYQVKLDTLEVKST
jgi:3-deoxy-manno-octulosonate cytidylyltransferase (CMP-KDO synthetase)